MRWPAYSEYKESGVQWLGDVPTHWNVNRLRRLSSRVTDGAHISPDLSSDDYPFVSTVDVKGGMIDFEGCLKTSADSFRYLVRNGCKPFQGDVLFSKDGTVGRTAVVENELDFVVASSLVIISPKTNELTSGYLDYFLNNALLKQEVELLMAGAALRRISIEKVARLSCLSPPLDEQKAIADFLDRETGRIDTLVAKKRRLIALLKEKRTALISRIVTRGLPEDAAREFGLEPHTRLKDSGIEWLGEVPEDWEVKKLRFLCTIETGDKDTINAEDDGEYPFFVRSQTVERINTYTKDCEGVLTAGDGAGVGKVFHYVNGKFDFHQRVYLFSNFRDITGRYFFLYLKEFFWRVAFDGGAKSTVDSLRRPMIASFPVVVPQKREQAPITSYLDRETAKLDELVGKVEAAIERLQEYRTALITAAVTGKIDVREAAA